MSDSESFPETTDHPPADPTVTVTRHQAPPADVPATLDGGPDTPPADARFAPTRVQPAADATPRAGGGLSDTDQATRHQAAAPARRSRPGLPDIPGYEVLAEIGRGGMGVVYKARQPDLNRMVALKMIIGEGFEGPEALMRFRLEAETAARVRHPNVVQVYDSGTCNGRPYLVLEWVEGGTLSSYLKGRPQPPRAAARTVELLARAVHAAHCTGIVHRDLKPGNVLVARTAGPASTPTASAAASTATRPDAMGVTLSVDGAAVNMTPKVTDFGLAKKLVEDTHLTETGRILGTPEFMAPEQARGDVRSIGPGTDVYALGVILYQMLTGKTPFHADSVVTVMRRVVEDEPAPPRSHQPKLPLDLQTICLKCMEKDPAKRYATAEALADDLVAFLHGLPIAARPAGAVERVWKWAARRPAVAALAVAATLFFVLGFAGVTWQWRAAVAQRDRAELAERQVRTEKAVTDAVNHFVLDDLLATATPEKSLGRKVTVEEVLQNASARVDGTFADQPQVAAAVRLVLGNSYRKLGLFDPAARHLSAGLDLRRQHLGDTHRDTLAAASDRGLLLADLRNWDEAIPLLRKVVIDADHTLGPDDPLTIEATGRLALVLQEHGETRDAQLIFGEALADARRALGPTDPRTLTILNDYGMLLHAVKKLPEAEAAFREAVAGREKVLAPTHPATLESKQNLAVVLDDEGRWADARPIHQQVLADKKKVLGREHIDTLSTMNNLADLLDRHGEPDAALPLFEEALEGFRRALGPTNPVTLRVQNNLGHFAFRLGRTGNRQDLRQRAENLMAAVLETRRKVLPPDHPDTLVSANDLSAVLVMLNRLDEAEPLAKEAVAGRRKAFGDGHPDTLQSVTNYVQLLGRRQQRAEAVAECTAALAAAEKAGTAGHANAVTLSFLLVEFLARDKPADALDRAERMFEMVRTANGDKGEDVMRARRNLGGILLDVGRAADAEPHLRAVHAAYRAAGPKDVRTVQAAGKLGACLLAQKHYQDAEPLLVGYFESIRGVRGVPPPTVKAAGEQVVKLYDAWGKPDKAAEWREKVK